ncbi:MAG: hypothetical protein IIA44_09125, partial [Acidobacteria bacterium]|nr:hypothetical protein [Acidobacteriota bacterium]
MMRGQMRSGKRWGVLVLGVVLVVTGDWVGADARNNIPATYSEKDRQEWVTPAAQVFDRRMHFVGGVWMSLENDGKWGNDHVGGVCREDMNRMEINYCPSFETPGGSRIDYLFNGGLWIGGIVGSDTLVSLAYEGWTGAGAEFVSHAPLREGLPPGYRSFNGMAGEDAPHLEQTYFTVYDDTTVTTALAATHIPLGVEVV